MSFEIAQSATLGGVRYAPEDVIRFEDGLLGFPECRRFLLLRAQQDGVFWLQSLDHEALTFLVVDPFHHFPGFAVDLATGDVAGLADDPDSALVVLAIVTLPRSDEEPFTANLQGPLVLSLEQRRGRQVILAQSPHGIRCPFQLEASRSAA